MVHTQYKEPDSSNVCLYKLPSLLSFISVEYQLINAPYSTINSPPWIHTDLDIRVLFWRVDHHRSLITFGLVRYGACSS